jgi:serine/threonine-protein kinase
MLTHDGVVKLMDFGVAQTAARMDTDAGSVKGTFSYMAPEQVRAKPLDKRADVFALGVILYELTTGTRLFRGSDVKVMTAIVENDVPPPSHRLPEFPPDLEEILMSALARDRGKRLPSASHLARGLEDFALRHGLLIGPRTLARFVNTVHPYEREVEVGVALVDESEPAQEVTASWNDDTDSDGAAADSASPEFTTEEINLEEVMALEEQDDKPTRQERRGSKSAAPPPLSGFDEEKENTEENPVVLLDSPKREETRGREYLQHLERRLKEDD